MILKLSAHKRMSFRTKELASGNMYLLYKFFINDWEPSAHGHLYGGRVITYQDEDIKGLVAKLKTYLKRYKKPVLISLAGYQWRTLKVIKKIKEFKLIYSFRNPNSGSTIYVYQYN